MSGESHEESFRTHANYLGAFAFLCCAPYAQGQPPFFGKLDRDLPRVADAVAASSTLKTGSGSPDLASVRRSLFSAWGTELLLGLSGELAFEDELMRLVNNWAVVQAYYAGYHGTHALIAARGLQLPATHEETQQIFATMWADRRCELVPCSLGVGAAGVLNAPRPVNYVHTWTGADPFNCWDLAATAIRTTREDAVNDRLTRERQNKQRTKLKAWQEDENVRLAAGKRPRAKPRPTRGRLTKDETAYVRGRVRTRTVLDYLYRLRIKANYTDAGMFIDGPEDETSSGRVHGCLVSITATILLIHELHVREVVGEAQLASWADDWLARQGTGQTTGLSLRRHLLS